MYTFKYKGFYIHDNFTSGEVKVQTPDYDIIYVKSVHAAKCVISRIINRGVKDETRTNI